MGGIFFSKILASFFLLKASNFKPWTCGNFTLKQKNLIYFSAKFDGIKPRIVHVCRASDRVGGKKLTFCGILEANCAGNILNCIGIVRDCKMFLKNKMGLLRKT